MKCFKHQLLAFILLLSSACFGQTYQEYFNKGNAEKDPIKKINYFTQAILVDKTDSAFYYRGVAKFNQEQYAEAIADYNQAIRLNPYFKWAIASRGQANYRLKNYTEAIADFDAAITIDKKYDFAYAYRGYIKHDLGKYTEAISEYSRAIEIDPNYSWYYISRGKAYCELDKGTEALYDYEQAIKLDPNNPNSYFHSGTEKIHLKKYQDAITDFDQAIKLSPKYDGAYNNRGLAKENLGRYTAAIEDYDKAIKLNPSNDVALNNKKRAIESRNASAASQYNAEPLGLKLGVTPLSDVQQKDNEMEENGYSKWTGGKIFTSKGTAHSIEGAQKITYIFNNEDLLDAVIIAMHKDYFHQVNSYLKGKYTLLSATVPFVGDKYTRYKQGSSIVEIDAPHLSFEMEVIYKTLSFDTAFRNKKAADAMEKRAKQKSKF
jgi:tetratricopeptide (TPR) repeat protein